MSNADIAVIGIGVMGSQLALQLEERGSSVALFDEFSPQAVQQLIDKEEGKRFVTAQGLEDMLALLAKPRKILLMIKAGSPVDDYIEKLLPLLDPGDVIIDGGNSHYEDTERRCKRTQEAGVHFVGTGISGGEEGARYGASLMPGGAEEAWPIVKKELTSLSAFAYDETACCHWMGAGGAGHFVKMVHNGIEYGCMQLLGEAFHVAKYILQKDHETIYRAFTSWKDGPMAGFLMEITADILGKKDAETGEPLVEVILDRAGQKGTGRWTCQLALEHGISVPTIEAAVTTRIISSAPQQRRTLHAHLPTLSLPTEELPSLDMDALQNALYGATFCTYIQGFHMLQRASEEHHWQLPFADIARIWTGGCIIRARMLEDFRALYEDTQTPDNLLGSALFRDIWQQTAASWRQVLLHTTAQGVPTPAFSSALAFVDAFRQPVLPTQLIQAQRDYFGAHQYERTDKEGRFHTHWLAGNTLTSDPV